MTGATGPNTSSRYAGAILGHVGKDGRAVEQVLVRAALDEPRAGRGRTT